MSNFVTLSKAEFEQVLENIDPNYQLVSGNEDTTCWEYVYEVDTPVNNVAVRVYSTVDKRTGRTRDRGKDAIRIVHWDTRNDRPVGKGKKILRVEGATTVGQRIGERIGDLVAAASSVTIMDWDYVRAVLGDNAPFNNFAKKLLEGMDEYGSLTEGQLAYVLGETTPKGWDTMEAKSKAKNPGFWQDYLEMQDDGDDDPDNGGPSGPTRGERTQVKGVRCEVCGSLVYDTPSGRTCGNGHGGIDGEPVPVGRDRGRVRSGKPNMQQIDKPVRVTTNNPQDMATHPTSGYRDWQYPFDNFNPVQTQVLPYAGLDVNLVIGANTSAGKTICAELLMDYTLNQAYYKNPGQRRNRVIYLSPLKSLTQEKYDDWQQRFPDRTITILTGDYTLSEAKKQQLAASDIIVMTSEMTDSRTRRMGSENNYWLKEVGLVIVDESHIISTGRGHAVESGLMRFTRINPDARLLLLSATMPNCEELAEWLAKLNGKSSHVVYSTWRPVVLEMNYVPHPIVMGNYGRPDYYATQEAKRKLALSIALGEHPLASGKENEKFLIFCHDKGTGRAMVKRLNDAGVVAKFHSADLEMDQRLETEQDFADRHNGIRVLVSTSTLAWGRNLPARNVIIVGVHRGIQEVDELDIIQMAGRAGRYGIDPAGTVYLVCPQGQERAWEHTFNNPRPIHSGFVSRDPGMAGKSLNFPVMAFHLLAEIENQAVGSVNDINQWFKRSLASHQEPTCFELVDAKGLLDDLRDMEMVEFKGNYVKPHITGLGKVSAWLYYSPYDVHGWYHNFCKYFEADERDDMLLCWAVADIDSNNWGYVPKDLQGKASEWAQKLHYRGVQVSDAVASAIAAHYCLTGQKPEGTIAPLARAIKYDIRRIGQAIALIDSMYAKWEQKAMWDSLAQRIMYGISEDMVELVQVDGIGGVTARKLYERGICTLADLALADNLKTVMQVASPARAKAWMAQARRLL